MGATVGGQSTFYGCFKIDGRYEIQLSDLNVV